MAETQVITRPQATPAMALATVDPQSLIAQAITAGASVETMERLVALAKDVRSTAAREAWYEAMAAFQARCPAIKKTRSASIATRTGGQYAYTYAPLDEIDGAVGPLLGELGLSKSWRSRVEGDKVFTVCRISHVFGHYEESGEIPMPIAGGDDRSGANPAQRVGIALTYGKRYSLLAILGIAPEDDDDAQTHGGGQARPAAGQPAGQGGHGPQGGGRDPEAVISENQAKRLHAIASGQKWSDDQLHELLTSYGFDSSKQVRIRHYDEICDVDLKGGYAAWKKKMADRAAAAKQEGAKPPESSQ